MVTETMKEPDTILRHKNNKNRVVKKKNILKQVGIYGITKAPCCTVTVICNIKDNKIITAFPTM